MAILAGSALAFMGCGDDSAEPEPTGPELEVIARGEEPIFLAQPQGRDELYVVERAGTVRAIADDGTLAPSPLLDISDEVTTDSEGGLFSIAFAPDFQASRAFYVSYSGKDARLHIVHYEAKEDASGLRADLTSRREIISWKHPENIHWGGLAIFGPDGFLYVASGEGGPLEPITDNAANLDSLLGKLLRIEPTPDGDRPYEVPSSNPLVGRAGRDEILAWGLRNPWRFSFDRQTGNLFIGDVGKGDIEEIDFVPAGKVAGSDFGWPALEGTTPTEGVDFRPPEKHVRPVLT